MRSELAERQYSCMILNEKDNVLYGNIEVKRWCCSPSELTSQDAEINEFLAGTPIYIMGISSASIGKDKILTVCTYRKIQKAKQVKPLDPMDLLRDKPIPPNYTTTT